MTINPSEQGITTLDRRESSALSGETGLRMWVVLLVVAGILLVLTLPILMPQSQDIESAEKEVSHGEFHVVIQEDAEKITPWESDFLRWIQLIEPSQWYYPSQEGFSRYNKKGALPVPVLGGYTQQAHLLPEPAETTTRLVAEIPPMDGREFLKRPIFIEIPDAPRSAKSEVLPARWRRVGGGSLANPPKFSSEELALLEDAGIQEKLLENDCLPTRLEVQFRSGISLPRVLVRRSCGVPELDCAAVNALRRLLYTSGLSEQVFSPAVTVFLEVDWRL